jgi:pimeloyl-ACP methyl ester carboxylesterase
MHAQEKMVQSGEAQLATVALGEPAEGTILLAMGATASMLWWPEPLIKGLVDGGYQVIRFDHRDTGSSTTKPPGEISYDLDDLAGDLLAIMDAYGVSEAHLVGMSLGGYLAQINALRYPERVLSLTLIASEPFGISYEAEGIGEDFMAHFSTMASLDWANRQAVAAFLLRIAELSAGTRGPFDRNAALDRIEGELSRTSSMQSAFNHSMIAGSIDLRKTAADLHCPVLIIHGSDDPIISVNAAHKAAQMIPRSELMILEGVGHELLLQDTPAIAQRILSHCRKIAPAQQ